MKQLVTIFLTFSFLSVFAQVRQPKPVEKDSLSSDVFIELIEKTFFDYYAQASKLPNSDVIFSELEKDGVDDISDAEICRRIKLMNETSAYKFDCNATTIGAIKGFIKSRKAFVKICMSRSDIYFDMYDEYFAKYDLPKSLKYLSVIESALMPRIKSPAGALGLWQFMYGTGKMYGLKDNSYMDERMDPRKSTDAACRYLKKLHEIYNDWNVALAAYNAGPGNVNRAIRRAGGRVSYWAIRPFLPKETQQYVPRFIAATYLFTFAEQHNIQAVPSTYTYYQLDTMCLRKGVNMSAIRDLIGWEIDSIKYFNPTFKGTYIPKLETKQCITGPLTYIGKLVSLEDSLYKKSEGTQIIVADNASDPSEIYPLTSTTVYEQHIVQTGETLPMIANKYNVSLEFIKQENNLQTNDVKPNQLLKIPRKVISSVHSGGEYQLIYDTVYYDTVLTTVHVVQRNENLDVIADLHKTSVDSLMAWNNLDDKWINIGQKLTIYETTKSFNVKEVAKKVDAQTETPPKQTTQTTTVKPQYHIVKQGELFNRIATKYNLSSSQLQKLNPNVNPSRITVGQKLRVK